MKYLLLIAIVVLVLWLLRLARRPSRPPTPPAPPGPAAGAHPAPAEIVACAHCGLMLPRGEALPGLGGEPQALYCCEAHRREREGA